MCTCTHIHNIDKTLIHKSFERQSHMPEQLPHIPAVSTPSATLPLSYPYLYPHKRLLIFS